MDKKVGFLGAGAMAEALASGFIKNGIVSPQNIYATDPVPARRDVFAKLGTNAVVSGKEVWTNCTTREYIVLTGTIIPYTCLTLREFRSLICIKCISLQIPFVS
jgi:hypothetical protein